ncbi:MAG: 16S rRNA (cytidine(1402)-2'-O)-methyltransferase [Desulfobulbaceae bacterium]|jgi:16S rRNA (cytidine1402-2'-O)-methyltransferase|nr:16S rRNA (cytidine(1402)-2'-O)-methyltransferase [Desulfobulbaceae bacterium]
MNQEKAATLYVVATPIGNLEDLTFRAARILAEVSVIAAEDTRHTRKLLRHYGISTPLVSYYRERENSRADELITRLLAGESVAVVADAGTPGVADPGSILVEKARRAGIAVVPIPGASALTAAVSVAGLDSGQFLFLGFPPARGGSRRKWLQSLTVCAWPLVMYESPRRMRGLLADMLELWGDRPAMVARELTKTFEETVKSTLTGLLDHTIVTVGRGEYVIIVWPMAGPEQSGDDLDDLLRWYRDQGEASLKDACRRLAADLNRPRTEIYQRALVIWREKDGVL